MNRAKMAVDKMHQKGELEDFIQKHDDFKIYGCGTIIAAVKTKAHDNTNGLSNGKSNGQLNGQSNGQLNGQANGLKNGHANAHAN